MTQTETTVTNPLQEVEKLGQGVWLDFISRSFVRSGQLARMIAEDGLHGVTSNPSIFAKAVSGSNDYQEDVTALRHDRTLDATAIFERLAVRDIQDAADAFYPSYLKWNRRDGYVSLEVSPKLANETEGTLNEARRLWKQVNRENLMVKVPGTAAGIPAIEQLIGDGININVTLLFSVEMYRQAAEAYIAGLEKYAASGGDLSHVASVASFFISRIDAAVDKLLDKKIQEAGNDAQRQTLQGLLGKTAIANAKLAYRVYQELFQSPRWAALAAKGAQPQRLLWASTSTKNPQYRDVMYVEELIGPDTVNTMPQPTLEAFRDHGRPRVSITEDVAGAEQMLAALGAAGISLDEVTTKLTEEGVKLFADSFTELLCAVEKQRAVTGHPLNTLTAQLPPALKEAVEETLQSWEHDKKAARLWGEDPTLWTNTDEGKWLGWLSITDQQLRRVDEFRAFADEIRQEGFLHALLLGMGGSSLCPEVLALTFGPQPGAPGLQILDSTDPAQIKHLDQSVDLQKTIVIVSSKSGGTLEPNIFEQYFFARMVETVGAEQAGRHFIAITDPGSALEKRAQSEQYRRIFHGVPSIGGRYSALSDFGVVPAAVMGLDVADFLDRTAQMVQACSACGKAADNPGVHLGAILGTAQQHGRDKVTVFCSQSVHDLGAWLEQLLAESTGKEGKALIPVDREAPGDLAVYGNDRLFVSLQLRGEADPAIEVALNAFAQAGHPVVRIEIADRLNLGQEFFRWEIATAVAGSIMGINAFNQPDVEAAKIATKKLTSEYEEKGSLPEQQPFFSSDLIKLFADEHSIPSDRHSLDSALRGFMSKLQPNDYCTLLAYIEMNPEHEEALQAIRLRIRDVHHVATCLGFGPRFQHSTGQAYKGGPDTGVFLQITGDNALDLPVPGQKYTFGVVKAAQAAGDLQVLQDRGRRALRIHLSSNTAAALRELQEVFRTALA